MGSYKPAQSGIGLPPPSAHPPTFGSAQVALTGLEARQRARAEEGMGFDNTIKTGPQGVQDVNGNKAPATLLGQSG